MVRAGCIKLDALAAMPPTIADRKPRDGDQRFIAITGRRPTIEFAVASVAEKLLPIRRGVGVASLLTGPSTANGIPHVTGVRTMDGEEVLADLVIDATGRASRLPEWLEAIGARRPIEESEDSGFIYYSRFFRSRNGAIPPFRAGRLTHFHSFSLPTSPGDAGTARTTLSPKREWHPGIETRSRSIGSGSRSITPLLKGDPNRKRSPQWQASPMHFLSQ